MGPTDGLNIMEEREREREREREAKFRIPPSRIKEYMGVKK
jgi:hypothetical protein